MILMITQVMNIYVIMLKVSFNKRLLLNVCIACCYHSFMPYTFALGILSRLNELSWKEAMFNADRRDIMRDNPLSDPR